MEESIPIRIKVNGAEYRRQVEPRLLLVDLIRDELGLTGTHIGCEEGICGACTVEVDGEIVKSCLVFAVQADGASITTIEGVADGDRLDPLQDAFAQSGALQCGYCTPGMVMAARALLKSCSAPSDEDIRYAMVGNLCRCTGYQNIIDAVKHAAEVASSDDEKRRVT